MSVYRKGGVELRLGDYRDVLADVEPDAVITDPPFGERTHAGQRTGSDTRKTTLTYEAWGEADAHALAAWADAAIWLVVFSDHEGQRWHEAAALEAGRYVFAPVLAVRSCPTPRMAGDGPTSAADYLTVSRPRRRLSKARRGSRPGYYMVGHTSGAGYRLERVHPGGKDLALMRRLVRDYSRPGDLVCDPCAGGATTLIAAALEGRRAIGAELDAETFEKACARIERTALTPPLFHDEPAPRAEQAGLAFDEPEAAE